MMAESKDSVYSVFLSLVKDSKVVLLGEPTHGEGNVFEYKTTLVKYLHDSLGFNTIAFESGFYDLYEAQRFIDQHPEESAIPYWKNSLFSIWTESPAFQPLLQYVDSNRRNLKIIGFDCQLTGIYSQNNLLDSITSILQQYKPKALLQLNIDLLQTCIQSFAEDFSFPASVNYSEFSKQIQLVKKQLQGIGNKQDDMWWYLQTIDNLMALGKDYYNKKDKNLNAETFKAIDSNPRDSMMAQNLLAYIKHHPNEKIICWGASTHFMNNPTQIQNEELKEYKPLGMYIKQALGAQTVINLTFISGSGFHGTINENPMPVPTPEGNSLEASLLLKRNDSFLILKKNELTSKPIVAYCLEYTPIKANWSTLFDAFVYLPFFTPSTFAQSEEEENDVPILPSYIDSKKYILGRLTDAQTKLPLAFANISIPRLDYGLLSNDSGNFFVPIMYAKDSFTISCLGYKTIKMTLEQNAVNVIHLEGDKNLLNEVTISAERLDVKKIMKQVKLHWSSNYETKPFVQKGYNVLTITNYDTAILNLETVNDYYAYFKFNSAVTQSVNCNEVNRSVYKKEMIEPVFSRIGVIPFDGSIIEPDETFIKNTSGDYDFVLRKVYDDKVYGFVFVIDYVQKKMNRWLTKNWLYTRRAGSLWIREHDYAILKISSKAGKDTTKLNKWANKDNEKNLKLGSIRLKHKWAITTFENEESVKTYVYNDSLKKYFVNYSKDVSFRKGYPVEDSTKTFDTKSTKQFYSLGNIIVDINNKAEPYNHPKIYYYNQKYHAPFWETFVRPTLIENLSNE